MNEEERRELAMFLRDLYDYTAKKHWHPHSPMAYRLQTLIEKYGSP